MNCPHQSWKATSEFMLWALGDCLVWQNVLATIWSRDMEALMQDIWSLGRYQHRFCGWRSSCLWHERMRHILRRSAVVFTLLQNEVFHIYSQYMSQSSCCSWGVLPWCGAVGLKGFDGPMTCATNWVSLSWNRGRPCATYPTQGTERTTWLWKIERNTQRSRTRGCACNRIPRARKISTQAQAFFIFEGPHAMLDES